MVRILRKEKGYPQIAITQTPEAGAMIELNQVGGFVEGKEDDWLGAAAAAALPAAFLGIGTLYIGRQGQTKIIFISDKDNDKYIQRAP